MFITLPNETKPVVRTPSYPSRDGVTVFCSTDQQADEHCYHEDGYYTDIEIFEYTKRIFVCLDCGEVIQ